MYNFLKNNKTDDIYYTHVSMDPQHKSKYRVDRDKIELFWKTYCDIIASKSANATSSGVSREQPTLAEAPESYCPVVADIDIKVPEIFLETLGEFKNGEKLYTDEIVQDVIQTYQNVLQKIVKDCSDQHLICVLLEKPMYTETKGGTKENPGTTYVKNGFHLHFPYIVLRKQDLDTQLISQVISQLTINRTFEIFGELKAEKYIDKSCGKAPWLMYGSTKNANATPYKVSKVFDANYNEISLQDAFNEYILLDSNERKIDFYSDVEYYLPRLLSIHVGKNYTNICELTHKTEILKLRKNNKAYFNVKYATQSEAEQLKIAEELLPLLSDGRVSDRNDWMMIGWLLFNISGGSEEGLELWCKFSSRADQYDNYDETICASEWSKMTKKNLSLGTLRYYAKLDNPEGYRNYVNAKIKEKYGGNKIPKGTHHEIAMMLRMMYGEKFACAGIVKKLWYTFKDHYWIPTEQGVELSKKISEDSTDSIKHKFEGINKTYYDKLSSQEEAEKKATNEIIKHINKIIKDLECTTFKNNVMKEAAEIFYDDEFTSKLDMNPNLIAFKNGVYDFRLNVFRPGRPEDCLSKCLPINYTEYKEDDEEINALNDFFEKVFPDASVRNYFLDSYCEIFIGGNFHKKVMMWLGEAGNNAKSITQALFEKMLGPYAIKMNTTVFTGQKVKSGNANADLARTGGGVRWAVAEETSHFEKINCGTLKHFTGNDSFFARDLFETGKGTKEIIPMFKLTIITNELPDLDHADSATFNRIRVIPFESKFDDDAPESYEEQMKQKHFFADKHFERKIPYLLEPLAWFLIERRKSLRTIIEPEKVKVATEMYKKQSDLYSQFVDQYIEEVESEGKGAARLGIDDLFVAYKEWYESSMNEKFTTPKQKFENSFVKRWGKLEGKGKVKYWKGYRFRDQDSDANSEANFNVDSRSEECKVAFA